MLDQEEKIINAQNRIVNIQYSALIVFGFIIFDLSTKMQSIADLFPVRLRQFKGGLRQKATIDCVYPNMNNVQQFELLSTVAKPGQPI
jgi:hypothetical protein